jgi:hypothetical protein
VFSSSSFIWILISRFYLRVTGFSFVAVVLVIEAKLVGGLGGGVGGLASADFAARSTVERR